MKVYVNEDCIGCELCNGICPGVFTMTDKEVAKASDEISLEQEDLVQDAADSCPASAIEIEL